MKFSDITGHEGVKERLRQMADSDRIPHALLLEGPAGTGKHALARAFVQYLHCTARHGGDSCGSCPSCIQHAHMQHIDTAWSFPVVKRNSKPTVSDDWLAEFLEFAAEDPCLDFNGWMAAMDAPNTLPRIYVEEAAALLKRLGYTSHVTRYKTVVMWQAHRMNEECANKLLKLIEEPSADTVMVMTTDTPRSILPTIYSRVQRIHVPGHDNATVAAWMQEHCSLDAGTAASLAPLARGSLSAARRLAASKDDAARWLDAFVRLMRLAYQRDIAALKTWSTDMAAEKREGLVSFLEYASRMLRENFVANLGQPALNLMTAPEAAFSSRFAPFINERNVLQLADTFSRALNDIRANANARIVMFDVAVSVILLLKQ